MENKEIAQILVQIGVRRNLKGFEYLTSCISHEIENSRTVWSTIRVVANEFGLKDRAIERDVRTAVESCDKNITPEDRKRLFGKQKMTTALFIKTVSSCIKDGTLSEKM